MQRHGILKQWPFMGLEETMKLKHAMISLGN